MEILHIKNFACIQELTLEINEICVLIGPQSSGKSLTAKLLHFFRTIDTTFTGSASRYLVRIFSARNTLANRPINQICDSVFRGVNEDLTIAFNKIFPPDAFKNEDFEITYTDNDGLSFVIKGHQSLIFELPPKYRQNIETNLAVIDEIVKKARKEETRLPVRYLVRRQLQKKTRDTSQETVYIPASRSYMNLLPAFYEESYDNSIQEESLKKIMIIDPFLTSFAEQRSYLNWYKNIERPPLKISKLRQRKRVRALCTSLLGGTVENDGKKEYIRHLDGRRIVSSLASSAQQEMLPLLNALENCADPDLEQIEFSLFIEEPEAHLFPSAQKKLMELLADCYNLQKNHPKIFITTHSPYILTSLNNLLLASQALQKKNCPKDIRKRYQNITLDPASFSAYYIGEGSARNLMKDNLILASEIDAISQEIGEEFNTLLDVIL